MENQEEQQEASVSIIHRALLVEDNALCQKIMGHYLSRLDYQVEMVADATTTIQKIQDNTYDLIVTDLGLPDKPGSEIIHAARHYKPNQATPLLVWSAQINKKDKEKYLALGADEILSKPCSSEELEKTIQQCFLTPGYERKFHVQVKILQEKWLHLLEKDNGSTEFVTNIYDLVHILFLFLRKRYLL